MFKGNVIKDELVEQGRTFLATYFETENAGIILMSESTDRLGTLAVSMPQQQKLIGPVISSILIGDRNTMISRILAELLAKQTKKIGLVSVFLRTISEQEAAPILKTLLEKILKKNQS
ncbi:MAG: proteasome assembly chaperone 4 family protein [Candidatus Bathyarchaeota archaeon]